MKRVFYLLAAFAGAVALPLAMTASLYVFIRFSAFTSLSINVSQVWSTLAFKYGIVGAGFGICSAALWAGTRRMEWRLLCALYGLGTIAYNLWQIWTDFDSNGFFRLYVAMVGGASSAPVLLWGLTLAFFALIMRSRRLTPSLA